MEEEVRSMRNEQRTQVYLRQSGRRALTPRQRRRVTKKRGQGKD